MPRTICALIEIGVSELKPGTPENNFLKGRFSSRAFEIPASALLFDAVGISPMDKLF